MTIHTFVPDPDPNEFTEREKFILSYDRSGQLANSHRRLGYDAMFAFASIGCVVYAVAREEAALGFVGYVLLLGRLYYLVIEEGRWAQDFQSILRSMTPS